MQHGLPDVFPAVISRGDARSGAASQESPWIYSSDASDSSLAGEACAGEIEWKPDTG